MKYPKRILFLISVIIFSQGYAAYCGDEFSITISPPGESDTSKMLDVTRWGDTADTSSIVTLNPQSEIPYKQAIIFGGFHMGGTTAQSAEWFKELLGLIRDTKSSALIEIKNFSIEPSAFGVYQTVVDSLNEITVTVDGKTYKGLKGVRSALKKKQKEQNQRASAAAVTDQNKIDKQDVSQLNPNRLLADGGLGEQPTGNSGESDNAAKDLPLITDPNTSELSTTKAM